MRISLATVALLMAAMAHAFAQPMTVAQGAGELAGTFLPATDPAAPVALIIPGSGPTDRDGNNPLGVKAAPLRLLAEGMAAQGVRTLRADKRGMFGSRTATPDANAVTIADYVDDARVWIDLLRRKTGASCVWLIGHSEGGLVSLEAAARLQDICGIILLASPGRPLADILREQLRANPANAPVLADALSAIDRLQRAERVDVSRMHPALQSLFAPAVQGFVIDVMRRDPAGLIATLQLPVLIVQGGRDLQVAMADAERLKAAAPSARLHIVPGMNHVLKSAPADQAGNLAVYRQADTPLVYGLVDVVAGFIKRRRQ